MVKIKQVAPAQVEATPACEVQAPTTPNTAAHTIKSPWAKTPTKVSTPVGGTVRDALDAAGFGALRPEHEVHVDGKLASESTQLTHEAEIYVGLRVAGGA